MIPRRYRVRVAWSNGDLTFTRLVDDPGAAAELARRLAPVRNVVAVAVESHLVQRVAFRERPAA
jgi:hypothetical protein